VLGRRTGSVCARRGAAGGAAGPRKSAEVG